MNITRYHKWLFAALALVYMLPFIQSVGMGVVSNDLLQSLSLSPKEMGVLGSAYLYAYAAVQLFSGLLAARLGPRLTLAALFMTAAAGSVLFALSESLSGAGLGRVLCGVGMAATMTSALTVFGRWFPAGVYGRITAWYFSIGGLGSFLATAPMALVNDAVGWRNTFLGLGAVTALSSLLMLIIVKDWPQEQLSVPGHARDGQVKRSAITLAVLWDSLKKAARLSDFWKLCAWYAFMSGTFYAFGGLWAGPYLSEVHGLAKTQVGGILSMGAVGFVVGNPLLTWLCEQKIRSYSLGLGGACLLGVGGVCLLVLVNDGLNVPLLYLMALMLGLAANAPNAVGYAAARSLFGARLVGTIGGILGFSSFMGGACLQVLCGLLLTAARAHGFATASAYAVAFAPFFLCAAIGAWSGFTLTEGYGREPIE